MDDPRGRDHSLDSQPGQSGAGRPPALDQAASLFEPTLQAASASRQSPPTPESSLFLLVLPTSKPRPRRVVPIVPGHQTGFFLLSGLQGKPPMMQESYGSDSLGEIQRGVTH